MNIIQAHQEVITTELVNIMIIEIFGDYDTVREACSFLSHNELHSEIIGYVPNID